MVKKFLSIILAGALMFSIAGCSGGQEATAQVEAPAATDFAELDFTVEGPTLLTSFGQSADVAMFNAIMTKAEIDFVFDTVAPVSALAEYKTLVIAVGASSKGLGAAGISVEDELARAEEILAAAEEAGMKIIVTHIGGESRRGETSDKFVNLALGSADYLIVVNSGNGDGLFTNAALINGTPIELVEKISDTLDPIGIVFGK